jgi:hypothetical protein
VLLHHLLLLCLTAGARDTPRNTTSFPLEHSRTCCCSANACQLCCQPRLDAGSTAAFVTPAVQRGIHLLLLLLLRFAALADFFQFCRPQQHITTLIISHCNSMLSIRAAPPSDPALRSAGAVIAVLSPARAALTVTAAFRQDSRLQL